MKEYFIKKRNYTPDVWNEIEPAKIDSNKWLPAGPPAEAKVFYDGENLYIRYEVKENSVTIRAKKMHDPVYQDSCAEFFMRPAKDKRYLNFETNAVGTMLLGLGETGEGRERVEQDPSIFEMKSSIKNPDEFKGDKWTLEYKIPFSFLRKIYGDFDVSDGFYGNFFKCGDKTPQEHYASWNEIESCEINFHKPEFFGKLVFEV